MTLFVILALVLWSSVALAETPLPTATATKTPTVYPMPTIMVQQENVPAGWRCITVKTLQPAQPWNTQTHCVWVGP